MLARVRTADWAWASQLDPSLTRARMRDDGPATGAATAPRALSAKLASGQADGTGLTNDPVDAIAGACAALSAPSSATRAGSAAALGYAATAAAAPSWLRSRARTARQPKAAARRSRISGSASPADSLPSSRRAADSSTAAGELVGS